MPAPNTPSASPVQDPNPAEPVSELVAEADVIILGTVESVEDPVSESEAGEYPAQHAVVRVDEVLKGEAPERITVTKPSETWYRLVAQAEDTAEAKHEGVLALKATGDSYELFGFVGVHEDSGDIQKFRRVLAGLPERIPGATAEQLKAWTAQADVIVFATARGSADHVFLHAPRTDFSSAATLTPIEVLKGEMTGPLDVVQGPQPDVPGGTWGFPVTEQGQTGVYFIDTSSGTPTVLNTTAPQNINRRQVPLG